jgi:hypothetical protein
VAKRRIAVSVVDIDPVLPEPDALFAGIAALHFKNKKSISFSIANRRPTGGSAVNQKHSHVQPLLVGLVVKRKDGKYTSQTL